MSDAAYANLIEDCVQERASLIGLIEAIESKMLAPGMPITIPEAMDARVFDPKERRTVLRLIAEYERLARKNAA